MQLKKIFIRYYSIYIKDVFSDEDSCLYMTDQLQDSLEEILEDTANEKHLDHLYKIWLRLDESGDFGTFKAFAAGNFAGAMIFLYSSYEGKKISYLDEREIKDLTHRILGYYHDLKPMINEYVDRREKPVL